MDDDIVSLTALTLILDPKCRHERRSYWITQLTLSMYLRTQCQLRLHHSDVVDLTLGTLSNIKIIQRRHHVYRLLDHLTLKLTERKLMIYLASIGVRSKFDFVFTDL